MIRQHLRNGSSFCLKTLKRDLRKSGVTYRKCAVAPPITKAVAAERIAWCKLHLQKPESFWVERAVYLDAHGLKKVNGSRVRDLLASQGKRGGYVAESDTPEHKQLVLQKCGKKDRGNVGTQPIDLLVKAGDGLRLWAPRNADAKDEKDIKEEKEKQAKCEKQDKKLGRKRKPGFDAIDARNLFLRVLDVLGEDEVCILDNESAYASGRLMLTAKQRKKFLHLPARSPDLQPLDFKCNQILDGVVLDFWKKKRVSGGKDARAGVLAYVKKSRECVRKSGRFKQSASEAAKAMTSRMRRCIAAEGFNFEKLNPQKK
jgi:hypothetical protein